MSKKQMSKKHWKGFAAAVACLLVAGIAMPSFAASPFRDVPKSHWGYSAIEEAYRDGAIGGTSYNATTGVREFSPEAPVTMAQFVNIMVRAFYPGELSSVSASGPWYAAAEQVAKNHDLFHYAPPSNMGKNLTRYDMAGILYAILLDKGFGRLDDSDFQLTASKIHDYKNITTWARDVRAVVTVVNLGLIGGVDSNGTFDGQSYMTRAQAAAVYVRMKKTVEQLNERTNTSLTPGTLERPGTGVPTAQESVTEQQTQQPQEQETQTQLLSDGLPVTEQNVLTIISSLRNMYPDGTPWTDETNAYTSETLGMSGVGCEAFALLCSDAAFGNLPITGVHSDFSDIKVGDILRINNDTHSVVVLEKKENSVIVTEGNFNKVVHWYREISREELEQGGLVVRTRYPI